VLDEPPLFLVQARAFRQLERRARPPPRDGRRDGGCLDPQEAQELGNAVDHRHAQVRGHVLQRLAVREATPRGREGAADGDVAQPQPRLQLVGEVLHLEVGPDADDPGPHGRHAEGAKRLLERGADEIGQHRRVDDNPSRLDHGNERCDERGARRVPDTVTAEVLEVAARRRVLGVVPVADVDRDVIAARSRPERAQEARERTLFRPGAFRVAEQAPALRAPDVELVRQRRPRLHRRDEVVLQALA
jgi:hypothetical protein